MTGPLRREPGLASGKFFRAPGFRSRFPGYVFAEASRYRGGPFRLRVQPDRMLRSSH
jgi:hypothetical protein